MFDLVFSCHSAQFSTRNEYSSAGTVEGGGQGGGLGQTLSVWGLLAVTPHSIR